MIVLRVLNKHRHVGTTELKTINWMISDWDIGCVCWNLKAIIADPSILSYYGIPGIRWSRITWDLTSISLCRQLDRNKTSLIKLKMEQLKIPAYYFGHFTYFVKDTFCLSSPLTNVLSDVIFFSVLGSFLKVYKIAIIWWLMATTNHSYWLTLVSSRLSSC